MAALLERTTFETARALDYFTVTELERQTGQPRARFAVVVLKELLDNALDACETAGVAPQIRVAVTRRDGECRITVADNGPGLPPDVLERILHLDTLTSDKAPYRSPTRGAQGNALKTVLGIPYALAGAAAAPVLVEACGVRHRLRVQGTAIGEVQLLHEREASRMTAGTRITVTVPDRGQGLDPHGWVLAYRVFNPHAAVRRVWLARGAGRFVKIAGNRHRSEHAQCGGRAFRPTADFYAPNPTWRKWQPSDPTSAHWYTPADLERLVFAHSAAARRGGPDLPLGAFVRQFAGLAGSGKVKSVLAALPGIRHLSAFEQHPQAIGRLLTAMQAESRPIPPAALGILGAPHLFHALAAAGRLAPGRGWYRKAVGAVDGVPFVVEVAVAESWDGYGLLTGVNFAPTYADPFTDAVFAGRERDRGGSARGLWNLLSECRSAPGEGAGGQVAIAVHLAGPALPFTDKGKTHLALPAAITEALGAAVRGACQEHARLVKLEERDAERAARERQRRAHLRAPLASMKDAVFAVLPEAVRRASGDDMLPFSARSLYYQVRPLIQPMTAKALSYGYFTPGLLTEYQEHYGPLVGLYYDPRGMLYEPHVGEAGTTGSVWTAGYAPWAGHAVALGTREVEAYRAPAWRFDKILFVEKKGLWPVLQATRLAERFDLAIVASEGYATRAARDLMAAAQQTGRITVLTLHDCDGAGYNIARTIEAGTRTSPTPIQIIDLGLTWADAQAAGLEAERVTRKNDLPAELLQRLSHAETQFLRGTPAGRGQWSAQRVELNAFTSDALVAFIEAKLRQHGLTAKVCPPPAVVLAEGRTALQHRIERDLIRQIYDVVDVGALARRLAGDAMETLDGQALHAQVADALRANPPESWDAVTGAIVAGAAPRDLGTHIAAALRHAGL